MSLRQLEYYQRLQCKIFFYTTFFAHNFIEIMLAFRFIPRVVALCCLFVESCMYVHDHKFAKYETRPWYRAPSLSPSDLIISGYL